MIVVAQLASPLASPPLYDGVVPQEPYRYLVPRTDQAGEPSSYHGSVLVSGASSPPFVAATTETPPQAQLIAGSGAFVLPSGVTSLTVSIEPVSDAPSAASGAITGNVYRVSVSDQAGTELAIDPATEPTISLRAPNGVVTAAISQLVGGTWHDLPTGQGGQPGVFLADVTDLGDFTTIEQEQTQGGPGSITVILGAATVLITAAVLGGVLLWRRSRPTKVTESARLVPSRPAKRRRHPRGRGGSR